MVPTMRLEGFDGLDAALGALSSRVRKSVQREALTEGAEIIARRARQIAPRAPGQPDMADHIGVRPVRDREHEAAVGIGVPRDFFYDYFLELGVPQAAAQPFYRPALDSEGAKALAAIGADLWRSLARRGISRPTTVVSTPVQTVGGGGLL